MGSHRKYYFEEYSSRFEDIDLGNIHSHILVGIPVDNLADNNSYLGMYRLCNLLLA